MKLSVSLPEDDLAILDEFVRSTGLPSRSAAVQHAVRMPRHPDLEDNYATAWQEWETSGGAAAWDATAADGIVNAAR